MKLTLGQRHLRYNRYYLQACRVGFPPKVARVFALQALHLDTKE